MCTNKKPELRLVWAKFCEVLALQIWLSFGRAFSAKILEQQKAIIEYTKFFGYVEPESRQKFFEPPRIVSHNLLLRLSAGSERGAGSEAGSTYGGDRGRTEQPTRHAAGAVPSNPSMRRVTCAHCHDNFLFNVAQNALARCPHCRKISSVGGDFK